MINRQICVAAVFIIPFIALLSCSFYYRLEADGPGLKAYAKFTSPASDRVALPAVRTINTGDIHAPHIASTSEWWTGVALLTTTATPKDLSVEFDRGDIVPLHLAPNKRRAFLISELFNGEEQPDLHSATIKNAAGVIGVEVYGGSNGHKEAAALLLTDQTAFTVYYPHLASDATWWTGIVAYNPSPAPTDIAITPYKADGKALSPLAEVIAGHGQYIGLASALGFPAGTAWFEIEASQPIAGFELFGTQDGKQLAGYSSLGVCQKTGIFAKMEGHGWTGIALVNLGDRAALVELTAHADDGRLVAPAVQTLAAHASLVHMAKDLFTGQEIGEASYIAYSSTEQLAGFQFDGSTDGTLLDDLPGL